MKNKILIERKIPEVWKYYFFFGIGLLLVHLIRYSNIYVTGAVPYYDSIIDYFYYSNISLLIRFISLPICILLIRYRSKYPVLSTAIIWNLLWVLLSHEFEIYTFLTVSIMNLFTFGSLIFYKVKKYQS